MPHHAATLCRVGLPSDGCVAWPGVAAGLAHGVHRAALALRFAFVLLLLSGAAQAAAEPVELPSMVTLETALHLFRTRGFDLLLADAQVQMAEADLLAAGAVGNPALSVGAGGTLVGGPAYFAAGITDGNAFFDVITGKRTTRRRVAQAALEAARHGRADALRNLEFTVKQVYTQAVLARDTLDFLKEVQRGFDKTFELTRIRYKSGAISEADEAKVETAKLEADQDVDRAETNLRSAKVALAFLLGMRGPVPEYHVDQDLPPYRLLPALAHIDAAALVEEARHNRPDLRQQEKMRSRAQAAIDAAKRLNVPDIGIGINYSQQGTSITDVSPPTLSAGLTLTLPIFYQQQGEIARARADLRTQSIALDKTNAALVRDVETAATAFSGAQKRVERGQGRLIERSKRARDLIELQYQKGAASLLEYLDAQRTFIANNIEFLNSLSDYWIAVYQLEQAVGRSFR